MYSKKKKKRETVKILFHQSLNLLNEHYYTPQSGDLDTFTQVREKERKKKEKEGKGLLRDIFVWCFPVGLLLPVFLKKRKEKGTVSEISSLFLWSSDIKFLLYLKCTLLWKSFGCVISSQFDFFCMYPVAASYRFH